MKKILLVFFITSAVLTGFGAVKTWTGTTSAVWTVSTNWSPAGAPSNGDEVIFDANGLNRNITGFTAVQLTNLILSNANGNTTYSIRSTSDQTLTITGGSGVDLDIQGGCGLTFRDHLSVTLSGGCSASVEGNLTANLTNASHTFAFEAGSTTTVTGSLTFGGASPGGTIVVEQGAVIDGFGNITHAVGQMVVDAFISFDGNFTNTAPITGVGTIETTGSWINASTIFGYPYAPPGPIVSGYTWSGSVGTDWADPDNWYGSAVPVATGDAVIYLETEFPELETPAEQCRRLYINDDGALLTIEPGGQLTVNAATTIGGGGGGSGGAVGLVIASDATGTGSYIDNGTIDGAGVATVERFFAYGASGLWHYASIPITEVWAWTYFDQYMKYYDESLHRFKYVIANGSDSLLNSDGLGYTVWPRFSDWTAENTGIPNTGTMNIPVTRTFNTATSDYDGWNLVGNPYPSAVDLSLLTGSWTDVDATAWFWDPLAGNYKVYPSGGGGSHSQYCPTEQSFFVHCNDASATPSAPGSGTVVMTNAARVHNSEVFLKNDMANILKVNVQGSPNAFTDELSVYFNDALTEEYDPGFDAKKLEGEAAAPQIFTTIQGHELAVNAQPFSQAEMVVPMSFKAAMQGSYMLNATELESFPGDVEISLEDLLTSVVQDLRVNPVYTFSHDPANDPARFLILFTDAGVGLTETPLKDRVSIYSSQGSLVIAATGGEALSGDVFVYDLLGRTVYAGELDHSAVYRCNVPVVSGYYIVRVVSPASTSVKRVFLDFRQ